MKFPVFKSAFFNKSHDKKSLFATVKRDLTFLELHKFVERFKKELPAHKSFFYHILLGQHNLPKDYKSINRSSLLYDTNSLEQELGWQAVGFIEQEKLINNFIKLKSDFDHNLLIGNYLQAREILDIIDTSICVSNWGGNSGEVDHLNPG